MYGRPCPHRPPLRVPPLPLTLQSSLPSLLLRGRIAQAALGTAQEKLEGVPERARMLQVSGDHVTSPDVVSHEASCAAVISPSFLILRGHITCAAQGDADGTLKLLPNERGCCRF